MKVTILQPAYLPWLGFFDRIARSDIYICLDHVPMDKNSQTKFTNRNKIRTSVGWSWLTVPVLTKGVSQSIPIKDISINSSSNWSAKHWKTLQANYSKSPFFHDYGPTLQRIYDTNYISLLELITDLNSYFFDCLSIDTKVIFSSALSPKMTKSSLILELCQSVGASSYLSGPFGRSYLDLPSFASSGIDVHFHDYQSPVYTQCHTGFEPCMSIIDLLFNHGQDSIAILSNA